MPENKLSAIKLSDPEVTSPEMPSASESPSTSRPQRLREPSAKALEAIATYNIQEQLEDEGEEDPQSFEEAMKCYDKDLWIKGRKSSRTSEGIKL